MSTTTPGSDVGARTETDPAARGSRRGSWPASLPRSLFLPWAAAGACLFVYVAIRALTLSFVHDESLTFNRFVGRSIESLVRYHADANHHLINTLTMKAAQGALGTTEISLRAGSLLAAAVYLIVFLVWMLELRSRLYGALALALAAANPFVLDFLGLARGYALGLACVATSALLLVRFTKEPSLRRVLLAAVVGGIGVLAHFGLLPYFFSLCAVLALNSVLAARSVLAPRGGLARRASAPSPRTVLVVIAGVVAGVVAVVAEPVMRLRAADALYFGAGSLWETGKSLADGSLYGSWPPAVASSVTPVAVVLSCGALVATVWLARRGGYAPTPSATLGLLVASPIAIAVAQHVLLEVPYPEGRTALFLVPLGAMWVSTVADELEATGSPAVRVIRVGAAAVVVGAVVNLAASLNVTHAYDWRYDADTERIVADLASRAPSSGAPLRVAASWQLEPTMTYYRATRGETSLARIAGDCREDCFDGEFDAYVAFGPDLGRVRRRGAVVVRRYRTSGAALLRPGPSRTR